jgi:hypothetical protein
VYYKLLKSLALISVKRALFASKSSRRKATLGSSAIRFAASSKPSSVPIWSCEYSAVWMRSTNFPMKLRSITLGMLSIIRWIPRAHEVGYCYSFACFESEMLEILPCRPPENRLGLQRPQLFLARMGLAYRAWRVPRLIRCCNLRI